MSQTVYLTDSAWEDLFSIYEYSALNNSVEQADKILSGLQSQCMELEAFPDKGHLPPEMAGYQRSDLREIRVKPYRIFYRIQPSRIDVLAVFDGRRDVQSLLAQRALRGEV